MTTRNPTNGRPEPTDNRIAAHAVPPHVLLVEDEPVLLAGIAHVLRLEGYSVTTAVSGREALLQLHREVPDLIVTDYRMPELDGAALIAEIRCDRRYRHLPIILFSTAPPTSCQADLVLDKGCDISVFLDAVAQLIPGPSP